MRYSIPTAPTTSCRADFYHFEIDPGYVMFAGSRHTSLDPDLTLPLVNMFGSLGFCLMTGCAGGVDASFRQAMAVSSHAPYSTVACAFQSRVSQTHGLDARKVVPHGLPPRVALAKRTVWMASQASLLILFPSSPIGRGSALALRSVLGFDTPAFVVSATPPAVDSSHDVLPSSLFGLVEGYWCIPHSLRLQDHKQTA